MASLLEILQTVDLFSGIGDDALSRVAAIARSQHAAAGSVIFEEGADGDSLYILPEGRVGIEMKLLDNAVAEQIHQARDHEVFGELALIDGFKRSARARALDNLDLVVIERKALVALMEADKALGYLIMGNLARIVARKLRDTNISLRNMLMQQKYVLGEFS